MRQLTCTAALLAALALPLPSSAHGLWGHIHVTGWAVENMPDDELRAFLLDDPEVFNALLFGAVFADTGYARGDEPASRAYSEHAHWEPFVEDYVQWVIENDPPPWDNLESKKRVAFLMGCASHGLQDTLFDSLFLYQAEQRDGVGQDDTDPATDGFLVMDEHIRFIPTEDIPMETVLELMADVRDDITENVINESVGLTTAVYINEELGLNVAKGMGQIREERMPWSRDHYMDQDVPGSLRSEIFPTMRYQQAIWERLHGRLSADQAAAFAYPELPRRLHSHEADSASSWISFTFGAGVRYTDGLTALYDSDGNEVPFSQANTRWGANFTRLIKLQPEVDLVPGATYTARLEPGIELINGDVSTEPIEVEFQVACDDDNDPACPDEDVRVASITGVPVEPNTGEPVADEPGCGCQSVPAGAGWMAFGLVPLLWRRRKPC